MCGRFTLTVPTKRIEEVFGLFVGLEPALVPRYNIAPTQNVLAVRQRGTEPAAFCQLRWGLVPFWAEDLKIGNRLINARADGIADKPAFREAFKRRRCLIVTDGFYEWQAAPSAAKKAPKQPFHVHLPDRRPFAFAGLWEKWTKGPAPVESCTIVTTDANESVRPLHDRMPVILDPKDYATWLATEPQDPAILRELLRPYPTALTLEPVSTRVNNPRFDDASCLEAGGES